MSVDLPFHKAWLEEEEHREIEDTLNTGWLTTGPKVQKFEEAFKIQLKILFQIASESRMMFEVFSKDFQNQLPSKSPWKN